MAETGFRLERAARPAEAKFARGAGIAEPDIVLEAVAAETARSARQRAAVAADRRKCCRIEPHPAQPQGYRRS
jgi:hypothetical protein